MKNYIYILFFIFFINIVTIYGESDMIKILTWNGYVTADDTREVNKILKKEGYNYEVEVINPYADNPEQMFDIVRKGQCDITFFTLFFIKLQNEKITNLLQTINVDSPRLKNYKNLLENLKNIPMGLDKKNKPYYIPFGGGAYGFWVDTNKVKKEDIPESINDFLENKWQGKFSLNISQPYYNVALASMANGLSPFELNNLVLNGKKEKAIKFLNTENEVMKSLIALYSNSGDFWESTPKFKENLQLVTSWGPEMIKANEKGGKWKLINLKEGNLVWLDTINFVKSLSGKKLEAAEIFANYMIGKKVQNRVVKELSMVAVSNLVESNPMLDNNSKFFNSKLFVPPFEKEAEDIIKQMSKMALKEAGVKLK